MLSRFTCGMIALACSGLLLAYRACADGPAWPNACDLGLFLLSASLLLDGIILEARHADALELAQRRLASIDAKRQRIFDLEAAIGEYERHAAR